MRATHPNIVQVFAIENLKHPESGDMADCIIMEYIKGPTICKFIVEENPIAVEKVLKIGNAIIDGVEHIHKKV